MGLSALIVAVGGARNVVGVEEDCFCSTLFGVSICCMLSLSFVSHFAAPFCRYVHSPLQQSPIPRAVPNFASEGKANSSEMIHCSTPTNDGPAERSPR